MTENWQQEPAPWLSTGRDRGDRGDRGKQGKQSERGGRGESGPESIPVMPHGLSPVPPQSYTPQPYTPQPYTQQPYTQQPYTPQPPQSYAPQPYTPQPYNAQPYTPPPYSQPARPEPPIPIVGDTDDTIDVMSTVMVAVGTVQPRAARAPQAGTVEEAERILGYAVDSLDADSDLYSFGTVTDGAACLVPDEGRWAVFLADGGDRRYAGVFDDPVQAAIHFSGVLLLAAAERGALPKHAGPAALPGRTSDPLAEMLAGPPITPLAGDPPTTLYTDQRLTILTPGTEVDRFGDQLGNTVYAARTRYPHRSLPPDYIERQYRVYRVRDPLRALTGTAIPWFGQPGGGMAYLLPRPIRDLLHEGALVEIPAATLAPS